MISVESTALTIPSPNNSKCNQCSGGRELNYRQSFLHTSSTDNKKGFYFTFYF
jgi:hypothetical protein